eukprot:CAMPEP_0179454606 /NCGR_PEP_ID=MMETSP0799-20121207/38456_1 /TAXON_ID=46947 /ORGANISM="Geminigera cryophila, Strain CCMP2564" /LENGTH=478 /DNA_ID=CAMNT_0021252625 /DNA_START=10 /DNA_END=1446 /DNA_ORIENTATION=-
MSNKEDELSEPKYLRGFGNEHATEAIKGALPEGQNNPQQCPFNLYAEQISGTAFTAARAQNLRTWLYRVHPSVDESHFEPLLDDCSRMVSSFSRLKCDPNQLRWNPMPIPDIPTDFIAGTTTVAGSGEAEEKRGVAIHVYACNISMQRSFYNADGDVLIVPQLGSLYVHTELGHLKVTPGEILMIPRGIVYMVQLLNPSARGYILEIFKGHFALPELGPLGANGLANARDFMYPVAQFDRGCSDVQAHDVVCKMGGDFFKRTILRSPYDVVAWHGNYAPFKYQLSNFCTMGSISFDHPDPSIFTVLTCASDTPGEATADFVVFPPRYMVAEKTFRPPYFHRNCMSEYMGMIHGVYDAKKGFVAGGGSLHSCMSAHGPDVATFVAASSCPLSATKFEGGLAFMFETSAILKPTSAAAEDNRQWRDTAYKDCWKSFPVTSPRASFTAPSSSSLTAPSSSSLTAPSSSPTEQPTTAATSSL